MKDNSPVAIKNKLLVLDSWTPNMDTEEYKVDSFPIWVQIWGLPLEYLSKDAAIILGTLIGPLHEVDFVDQGIRNLRYLQVRVQVQSAQPLMMGFYLRLDNGVSVWIQFRYERIFCICRKCGCVGHIDRDCLKEKDEIQAAIDTHLNDLQVRHTCQRLTNQFYPLFVSQAAAFCDSRSRRTTRFSFSHHTAEGPKYTLHDHNLLSFRRTGRHSPVQPRPSNVVGVSDDSTSGNSSSEDHVPMEEQPPSPEHHSSQGSHEVVDVVGVNIPTVFTQLRPTPMEVVGVPAAAAFSLENDVQGTVVVGQLSGSQNDTAHFPPNHHDVAPDLLDHQDHAEDLLGDFNFNLSPPLGNHARSVLVAGKENGMLHQTHFNDIFLQPPPIIVHSLVGNLSDMASPSHEDLWASLKNSLNMGMFNSLSSKWAEAQFQFDSFFDFYNWIIAHASHPTGLGLLTLYNSEGLFEWELLSLSTKSGPSFTLYQKVLLYKPGNLGPFLFSPINWLFSWLWFKYAFLKWTIAHRVGPKGLYGYHAPFAGPPYIFTPFPARVPKRKRGEDVETSQVLASKRRRLQLTSAAPSASKSDGLPEVVPQQPPPVA